MFSQHVPAGLSRLLVLGLLLLPCLTTAQTDHSGTCTGTFAAADNPHRLVGSCTVPAGETLTIESGATLAGQNNVLFIDGMLNVTGATLVDVSLLYRGTSRGTVQDSTVQVEASGTTFPVQIGGTATPVFRNNVFEVERFAATALFISSMAQPTVVDNTFTLPTGSTTAIHITGTALPTIQGNTIESTTAIHVTGTALPTIQGNTITTNFHGLFYDSSSGGTATGNTIGFVAGGARDRRGIVLRQGASPRIDANEVLDDPGTADVAIDVGVDATSTATVTNNQLCTTGEDRALILGPGVFRTALPVTVEDNTLVCEPGLQFGLLASATVTTETTFRIVQGQQRYTLLGTWTVAAGATLTIPPDFTVQGPNGFLAIDGMLNVTGATLVDVGLFYRGSGGGTVQDSTVQIGPGGSTFPFQITGMATPTLRNNVFEVERFAVTALFIGGMAQPTVTGNTFTLSTGSTTAVWVSGTAQPTIRNNGITTNSRGLFYDGSSGGMATGNTIGFVAGGARGRRGIMLTQGASPRLTANEVLDDPGTADVALDVGVDATSTAIVTNNRLCVTGEDRAFILGPGVFRTARPVTVENNPLGCEAGLEFGLLASARVEAPTTLRTVQGQQRYTLLGSWTVAAGATLTIPAGFTVQSQNGFVTIEGVLQVNGATLVDVSLFYRDSGGGTVQNSTVQIGPGGPTFPLQIIGNATPALRTNVFQVERSATTAVFISNTARPTVTGNTFTLSAVNTRAVWVSGTAQPTIRDNRITTNFRGLFYDGNSGGTVTGNTIGFVLEGNNDRAGIALEGGASPRIDNNNVLDDPARTDIAIDVGVDATSTATVTNNRLCVTGEDRAFGLGPGVFATGTAVVVDNNTLVCEAGADFALSQSGRVTTDTTLRAVQGRQSYALNGWTVNSGATLTIPAGLTVTSLGTGITVNGALVSDGATLTNVTLFIQSGGTGTLTNSIIRRGRNNVNPLFATDATVTLRGNVFEGFQTVASLNRATTLLADANTFRANTTVFSINAPQVRATVRNNLFDANTRSLLFINAETLFAAFPADFDSNTFLSLGTTAQNLILLQGATLDVSGTLPAAPVPYDCSFGLTIAAAATVVMEPGVALQCGRGTSVTVTGELIAVGTPQRPVVFTVTDPKAGNRWRGLTITNKPATAPTVLEHCIVEFATTGIRLDNASIPMRNCLIADNAANGVELVNGAAPRLEDNAIVQNLQHGIQSATGANPLMQGNTIFGNGLNGIQNDDTSVVINAENNFWGADSGPRDVPTDARCNTLANPDGTGDEVSDCVDFDPWTRVGPSVQGTIVVISGSGQTGTAGELLREPLVIEIRDLAGQPLAGIEVIFSVAQGDATVVEAMPVRTRRNGRAAATVRLGLTPGEVRIAATARDVDSPLAIFLGETNAPCLFVLQTTDGCPRDGDVNHDGRLTPADAHLVLQQALGTAEPPMDACTQARADVATPPPGPVRDVTTEDAVCIFRAYHGRPSCLDSAPVVTRVAR